MLLQRECNMMLSKQIMITILAINELSNHFLSMVKCKYFKHWINLAVKTFKSIFFR